VKIIDLGEASLDGCVTDAQRERVVIVRDGKPVALIIGVEGLDQEQLRLGSSDRFWTLIGERRREKTVSRAELEEKLRADDNQKARGDIPSLV
jgi:antitoxin (DNA-binding transcriptional repressor) of toxin-antitoxin stability system